MSTPTALRQPISPGMRRVALNVAAALACAWFPPVGEASTSAAPTPAVTLSCNINPSVCGQPVPLIATVTPSDASGSIEFFDGVASLGSASISGGVAAWVAPALVEGRHDLAAAYGGDSIYAPANSPVYTQIVSPAAPPQVTVVFPNDAYLALIAGGDVLLQWSATGYVSSVDLLVSIDYGATYVPIATGLPNTGNYVWSMSYDFRTNSGGDCDAGPTFSALLKVRASGDCGAMGEDVSDEPFAIWEIPEHADPPPSVWISSATVTEGNSGQTAVSLTIEKDGYPPFQFKYATAEGSATAADHDYVPASGTLQFGNYPGSQTLTIQVNGDLAIEPDESFTVIFTPITCYGSVGGPATVTIVDDDAPRLFGAPTAYATQYAPASLVVADLNRDGKPDVVSTNTHAGYFGGEGSSVSVRLGDGAGHLGPRTDFTTGSVPYGMAARDLDGDGVLDLAIANQNDNTVSVLRGNDAGGFAPKNDFAAGTAPRGLALGDFNADGSTDIAVANSIDNSVSVLLGTGGGGFGPKTDIAVGLHPLSLAIADLNADGKPDLAVTNASNSVSVLLGTGDGSFGARADFACGSAPASLAIGDMNADGHPDLVTANTAPDNTVSLLLGNGDATFGSRRDFGTGILPVRVAIGDVDEDGRLDIAIANSPGDGVSVLLGNGDGSFGVTTTYRTGTSASSVAIADLNADRKPDLVVGDGNGAVSVLLNIAPLGPTSTALTLFEATWSAGGVELSWSFGGSMIEANTAVERSEAAAGPWATVTGERREDGTTLRQVDASARPGLEYFYRLRSTTPDGSMQLWGPVNVSTRAALEAFALLAVSPTPAHDLARITFALARAARVRLSVIDVEGRRLALLADQGLAPGRHEVAWDGTNTRGRAPAGLYFVRYEWPGGSVVKRVVLAR